MAIDNGYTTAHSDKDLRGVNNAKIGSPECVDNVEFTGEHGNFTIPFEIGDVGHPILATSAIEALQRSVLHSPAGSWIIDAVVLPPSDAEIWSLEARNGSYWLPYSEIVKVNAVKRAVPAKFPSTATSSGELPATLTNDTEGDQLQVRIKTGPKLPTDAERLVHEATHVPYRSWCWACVAARGRDDPHTANCTEEEGKFPRVSFDFFSLGDDQEVNKCTGLVLVDFKSLAVSVIMGSKVVDEFKVTNMASTIDQWGHQTITLQSDQEPSTLALLREIQKRRVKGTIIRGSKLYSHQSNALAENTVGIIGGIPSGRFD